MNELSQEYLICHAFKWIRKRNELHSNNDKIIDCTTDTTVRKSLSFSAKHNQQNTLPVIGLVPAVSTCLESCLLECSRVCRRCLCAPDSANFVASKPVSLGAPLNYRSCNSRRWGRRHHSCPARRRNPWLLWSAHRRNAPNAGVHYCARRPSKGAENSSNDPNS